MVWASFGVGRVQECEMQELRVRLAWGWPGKSGILWRSTPTCLSAGPVTALTGFRHSCAASWTLFYLRLCHLVVVRRLTVAPAVAVAPTAHFVSDVSVLLPSSSSAPWFRVLEAPITADKALPRTASISGCRSRVGSPLLAARKDRCPLGWFGSIQWLSASRPRWAYDSARRCQEHSAKSDRWLHPYNVGLHVPNSRSRWCPFAAFRLPAVWNVYAVLYISIDSTAQHLGFGTWAREWPSPGLQQLPLGVERDVRSELWQTPGRFDEGLQLQRAASSCSCLWTVSCSRIKGEKTEGFVYGDCQVRRRKGTIRRPVVS